MGPGFFRRLYATLLGEVAGGGILAEETLNLKWVLNFKM